MAVHSTFKSNSIYRNVSNPVWVFVIFQTNRSIYQLKDNSIFDHVNVLNLWMKIGRKLFREESWDLGLGNNYYVLAYEAYKNFKRYYFKADSIPYIEKKDFKSMYPIYSINLTNQPQSISGVKSNVILHVDFNKSISDPSELMKELFIILL